jgi:hypothetical protein
VEKKEYVSLRYIVYNLDLKTDLSLKILVYAKSWKIYSAG